jgi:hypothetical protein
MQNCFNEQEDSNWHQNRHGRRRHQDEAGQGEEEDESQREGLQTHPTRIGRLGSFQGPVSNHLQRRISLLFHQRLTQSSIYDISPRSGSTGGTNIVDRVEDDAVELFSSARTPTVMTNTGNTKNNKRERLIILLDAALRLIGDDQDDENENTEMNSSSTVSSIADEYYSSTGEEEGFY